MDDVIPKLYEEISLILALSCPSNHDIYSLRNVVRDVAGSDAAATLVYEEFSGEDYYYWRLGDMTYYIAIGKIPMFNFVDKYDSTTGKLIKTQEVDYHKPEDPAFQSVWARHKAWLVVAQQSSSEAQLPLLLQLAERIMDKTCLVVRGPKGLWALPTPETHAAFLVGRWPE